MTEINHLKVEKGVILTIFFNKFYSKNGIKIEVIGNTMNVTKGEEKYIETNNYKFNIITLLLENAEISDISMSFNLKKLKEVRLIKHSKLFLNNLNLEELNILCGHRSYLYLKKIKGDKLGINCLTGSEIVEEQIMFNTILRNVKEEGKITFR